MLEAVGRLEGSWAFLDRSKGHLELNFNQHGKRNEKERLDFRKIIENRLFLLLVF